MCVGVGVGVVVSWVGRGCGLCCLSLQALWPSIFSWEESSASRSKHRCRKSSSIIVPPPLAMKFSYRLSGGLALESESTPLYLLLHGACPCGENISPQIFDLRWRFIPLKIGNVRGRQAIASICVLPLALSLHCASRPSLSRRLLFYQSRGSAIFSRIMQRMFRLRLLLASRCSSSCPSSRSILSANFHSTYLDTKFSSTAARK